MQQHPTVTRSVAVVDDPPEWLQQVIMPTHTPRTCPPVLCTCMCAAVRVHVPALRCVTLRTQSSTLESPPPSPRAPPLRHSCATRPAQVQSDTCACRARRSAHVRSREEHAPTFPFPKTARSDQVLLPAGLIEPAVGALTQAEAVPVCVAQRRKLRRACAAALVEPAPTGPATLVVGEQPAERTGLVPLVAAPEGLDVPHGDDAHVEGRAVLNLVRVEHAPQGVGGLAHMCARTTRGCVEKGLPSTHARTRCTCGVGATRAQRSGRGLSKQTQLRKTSWRGRAGLCDSGATSTCACMHAFHRRRKKPCARSGPQARVLALLAACAHVSASPKALAPWSTQRWAHLGVR